MNEDREALKKIRELARPRQTLTLREAIDIICDIWNTADQAILDSHRKEDAFAILWASVAIEENIGSTDGSKPTTTIGEIDT